MKLRKVPLSQLHLDPTNSRTHNDRNISAINGSLKKFGQVEPLVVQKKTGKVIGGNGRLTAMAAVGVKDAWVYEVDIDDAKAAALSITLNRTAELAEWDWESLSAQLRVLKESSDIDLLALGWEDYELEPLLQAEWQPPALDSSNGTSGEEHHRTPPIFLNPNQRKIIDRAVIKYRKQKEDDALEEGEAVTRICKEWMK